MVICTTDRPGERETHSADGRDKKKSALDIGKRNTRGRRKKRSLTPDVDKAPDRRQVLNSRD